MRMHYHFECFNAQDDAVYSLDHITDWSTVMALMTLVEDRYIKTICVYAGLVQVLRYDREGLDI